MKRKCVDRYSFDTRPQDRNCVFEYLELFYKRHRLHSSSRYSAPEVFENIP
ncbi:MAG: IS3 family transposase [Chloroflexi bacterium]|nr:IS3 family transposase [Chloroflexota bacterium]